MFDRSAYVYDLIYDAVKDYRAEADALVGLIQEMNPGASSLLDVACGTGRHLELLRSAFPDIAGIDLEPTMLEIARGRLPDAFVEIGDMRTFDLGRTFDVVTCLFSSIGYMATVAELDAALARMAAHLAPGGLLVVDGWVKAEAWLPGVNVHAIANSDDETAVARVSRTQRDGDRTHLEMRYLIATADGFTETAEHHTLTLFDDAAYTAAFRSAGLEPKKIAGPMGEDRDRYVAVAP